MHESISFGKFWLCWSARYGILGIEIQRILIQGTIYIVRDMLFIKGFPNMLLVMG